MSTFSSWPKFLLILLELISQRNVATAMLVRNGSFLVFFVERRKLKEASENGTKRAIDILKSLNLATCTLPGPLTLEGVSGLTAILVT